MEQTIGKRIARHRKELGLTQDALAEQLGVTAQAVSKWENDQSCPDISMLPKLAEVFHTSTDALLGVGQMMQKQPATEKTEAPEKELHWDVQLDGSPMGRVGVAVWILLAGGLLFASGFYGWGAGLWEILWPSALLVFGLLGLFSGFSGFRLGCALFGGGFLLSNLNLVSFPGGKQLMLPVCLVIFGLCMLADSFRKPGFRPVHKHGTGNAGNNCYQEEGDRFSCCASFAEQQHRTELPRLSSGEVRVSFGAAVLDLTGCAEITDGCVLEADCSFGDITLCIPRNCRVEQDVRTGFSALSVDGDPEPGAEKTIYLRGSVHFGQLQIRYI